MKILILSSIFPPNIFGGAEIAAHSLACLLVRRGHDVCVVTLKEKNESVLWGEIQADGFRLYRIKSPRKYTLFARGSEKNPLKKLLWHMMDLFDFRNKKDIEKIIEKEKPDCVDVHNIIGIGFNTLNLFAKRNIPIKYFLHDFSLACFHASMFKNRVNCNKQCIKCKIIGNLRQNAFNKIKKIGFIAPSNVPFEKINPIVSILNDKPNIVIKNAPEHVNYKKTINDDSIIKLVYVGRLDPVKGIDLLLNVLTTLSSKFNFIIDILGTGPMEATLRDKYKNANWCRFHGFVPSTDVSSYISSATLFCMPSQWAEVYGLGTAQALRFGVPVIGSNIGGTASLVRHELTGILVDPNNEKEWIDAFIDIFSSNDKINILRSGAEKYKHEFSDDEIGNLYENFSIKIQQI